MGLEFFSIYNWVKILHIAFVVAWMAGLLYLPRLFVYHQENVNYKTVDELFKTMEHRLYFFIMYPSLFIVWATGFYLGYILGFESWLLIKVGFVLILSFYHFFLGKNLQLFKQNRQRKSSRYFRFINEIPFVIMFFILILVIMKPFM